jgi:Leucine-rich repeat (LRR) protein
MCVCVCLRAYVVYVCVCARARVYALRVCPALTRHSLSFNRLKDLPLEACHLEQLRFFMLHHNQLTEMPPAIGYMTSLKSLDLSFNKLFVLLPSIGNLKEVETTPLRSSVLVCVFVYLRVCVTRSLPPLLTPSLSLSLLLPPSLS